jgi:hypothetical protein
MISFSCFAPEGASWLPSGRTNQTAYQDDWTRFIDGGGGVVAAALSELPGHQDKTPYWRRGTRMADSNDTNLGMDRDITRRDFLNGVAIGVGASLVGGLPDGLVAALRAEQAIQAGAYYPATRTGMRGSHDGSWETAHALRHSGFRQSAAAPTDLHELQQNDGGRR